MQKDKLITIIKEISTGREHERPRVGLADALLSEDSSSKSFEIFSEERLKAPGYMKKDEKFVDQYSTVRDLAQQVPNKNTKEFEVNIPGVPNKISITKNRYGLSRVYTGTAQASEEEEWTKRSSTKEEKWPVIEIVPDSQPGGEPPPEDAALNNNTDDLEKAAKEAEEREKERWQQIDDREETGREYDTTFSGHGNERVPVPPDDDRPANDSDVDTRDHGDKDPGEDPQGRQGNDGNEGESEGGDVIMGPPETEGQPPGKDDDVDGTGVDNNDETPVDDEDKDVIDFIDSKSSKAVAAPTAAPVSESRRGQRLSLMSALYAD